MTNRIPSFKEFVNSVTIADGGTGYIDTPTLFFPAPTGDNPVVAAATLTLTGGSVTGVTITAEGDGYDTAPVPYVIGFPTQLTNTSVVDSNRDAGTYTSIPTTTNSATGSGATVNITVDSSGAVTSITIADDGNERYKELDTLTVDPISIGGQSSDASITANITKINNGSGASFTTTVDKIAKSDVYSQPKISEFAKNQLPEHIQSDFPLFVTFMQKYYEFMEQTDASDNTKHGPLKVLQDFLSKLDVDFNDDGSINTDDNFLKEFYRDYVKDFPITQSSKLSRVLKDINEFYTAKGSPEAVKWLFKIVFNESIAVVNREQFILRPSSNVWQEDYVVKVNKATGAAEPETYEGAEIDIHYFISTGVATQQYLKTATVDRVKKISYTNPQAYELTLNLDKTFEVVGPGIGQAGYDEQLHAYVSGNIATVTGTGAGGSFVNPHSSVVDGTYSITSGYTARIDVAYANNTVYAVGDNVKAGSKQYVVVGSGTTANSGSGPTHDSGDALDGTCKFRYVSDASSITSGSSGATFSVVIAGNAVSSVTVTGAGTDYRPNEIIEMPTTLFGGSGTPAVTFKVATISSGKVAEVLILDGGTGFSANPSVSIRPNAADTISTNALLDTRITDGVITSTIFTNNQQGVGYNNAPSLTINVAGVLTYITAKGTTPSVLNAQMFPVRILKSAVFSNVKAGSSATAGGFTVGQTFKVNETGDILGVYALDYFAEDYTLTGVDNGAYIKIKSLDSNGYPSTFSIVAVGVGFLRADFEFEITSSTGNVAVLNCKTGYNATLLGTHRDAGSFLSDINRIYDNRTYQPFSYSIESERQQHEWNDYVKRATHTAGFGLFGDLQIRQAVDMSTNFAVETDVYMYFKYPETEEVFIQDAPSKEIGVGEAGPDEIFPGDGLATRAGGTAFNRFDVGTAPADSIGIQSTDEPYVLTGTFVNNYYATSDGTPTGSPYFEPGAAADGGDDYVERFSAGDYFAEDYVQLGNPLKEIGLNSIDITFAVQDTVTSLGVETTASDTYTTDDSTILISFVFFRTPSDTFDTADAAIVEAQPRPSDTSSVQDAVDKFDVETALTDVAAMQDSVAFDAEAVAADTFNGADTTAFDVTTTAADTFNTQDAPSVEAGPVVGDTSNTADALDKFDIGRNPADTSDIADAFDKFDVTATAADTAATSDSPDKLDVTTTAADTFGAGDAGSLISQSYTVDLTYFAEDYVADTVINF